MIFIAEGILPPPDNELLHTGDCKHMYYKLCSIVDRRIYSISEIATHKGYARRYVREIRWRNRVWYLSYKEHNLDDIAKIMGH